MTLENTKNLKKQVAPFEKSTIKKSVWQLINTIVPFIILGSGAKILGLRKLNKRFLTELNFMLLNQRFHG